MQKKKFNEFLLPGLSGSIPTVKYAQKLCP